MPLSLPALLAIAALVLSPLLPSVALAKNSLTAAERCAIVKIKATSRVGKCLARTLI